MIDKNMRRLGRRTLAVYREQARDVSTAVDELQSTCAKGCHHCCKQVIMATLPEGVALASALIADDKLRTKIPAVTRALYVQVKHLEENTLNDPLDCVFLSSRDGTCGVYSARPAVCRYRYAVTPPENCSTETEQGAGLIDFRSIQAHVWSEGDRVSKQENVPFRLIAPLPVVTLWGLKILHEGCQAFLEGLSGMGSVMHPTYWLERLADLGNETEDETGDTDVPE